MEKILNGDFLRAHKHFLLEDFDVRGLAKLSFGNKERNIASDTTARMEPAREEHKP